MAYRFTGLVGARASPTSNQSMAYRFTGLGARASPTSAQSMAMSAMACSSAYSLGRRVLTRSSDRPSNLWGGYDDLEGPAPQGGGCRNTCARLYYTRRTK